jgi:hypothetical protein
LKESLIQTKAAFRKKKVAWVPESSLGISPLPLLRKSDDLSEE